MELPSGTAALTGPAAITIVDAASAMLLRTPTIEDRLMGRVFHQLVSFTLRARDSVGTGVALETSARPAPGGNGLVQHVCATAFRADMLKGSESLVLLVGRPGLDPGTL